MIAVAQAALPSPGCIGTPPLRNTKSCSASSSRILAATSRIISGENSMPLRPKLKQQQIGALHCTVLCCIGLPLTCLHLEDLVYAAYQLGCFPHYVFFLDLRRTFAHVALPCRQRKRMFAVLLGVFLGVSILGQGGVGLVRGLGGGLGGRSSPLNNPNPSPCSTSLNQWRLQRTKSRGFKGNIELLT